MSKNIETTIIIILFIFCIIIKKSPNLMKIAKTDASPFPIRLPLISDSWLLGSNIRNKVITHNRESKNFLPVKNPLMIRDIIVLFT